ncbi:autoinducer binding domain-containing protein [Shimia sp.]|uniref:helix-turn-helix transcriptional regulator n=1 Tax=Shimia sp. TaxID=1954381 RepID=UPI0035630F1D
MTHSPAFKPFHQRAERIVQSESVHELWQHHLDFLASVGFDRALYLAAPLANRLDWGDIRHWLVLTNFPAPVIDVFLGDDLHKTVARVVKPYDGPRAYSWSDPEHRDITLLSRDQQRHRDLCRDWGIHAGYTIWFSDRCSHRKAVIALCARRDLSQPQVDALWQQHGSEIHALCRIMHLKVSTLPAPAHRDLLTARQREVLSGVADGRTVQDIAEQMSLSAATVEKHLRLARAALNAETTASAVRKAAELNQLFLLP